MAGSRNRQPGGVPDPRRGRGRPRRDRGIRDRDRENFLQRRRNRRSGPAPTARRRFPQQARRGHAGRGRVADCSGGAVAVREALLGWAWMSPRTNSLTGARYGNFRSLAVADIPDRSHVGELLLAAVLRAAADAGLTQLTGKVHARNLGMRALYRKFGFEAAHLTMEVRLPPGGEASS